MFRLRPAWMPTSTLRRKGFQISWEVRLGRRLLSIRSKPQICKTIIQGLPSNLSMKKPRQWLIRAVITTLLNQLVVPRSWMKASARVKAIGTKISKMRSPLNSTNIKLRQRVKEKDVVVKGAEKSAFLINTTEQQVRFSLIFPFYPVNTLRFNLFTRSH